MRNAPVAGTFSSSSATPRPLSLKPPHPRCRRLSPGLRLGPCLPHIRRRATRRWRWISSTSSAPLLKRSNCRRIRCSMDWCRPRLRLCPRLLPRPCAPPDRSPFAPPRRARGLRVGAVGIRCSTSLGQRQRRRSLPRRHLLLGGPLGPSPPCQGRLLRRSGLSRPRPRRALPSRRRSHAVSATRSSPILSIRRSGRVRTAGTSSRHHPVVPRPLPRGRAARLRRPPSSFRRSRPSTCRVCPSMPPR